MTCHWKNGQGYCMAPHCDCNQGRNCPARPPARYRQTMPPIAWDTLIWCIAGILALVWLIRLVGG